jgi:hypothetical protein
MIVYVVYDFDSNFPGEKGITTKAGSLLVGKFIKAEEDVAATIRLTGERLSEVLRENGFAEFAPHVASCARECIANLPAEEL